MKANMSKLGEYTPLELSLLIWLGAFGSGQARKNALGKYYDAAQDLVEKQAKTGVAEPDPAGQLDLEKLTKAVKETYTSAADDLIAAIKKEAK